jgi:transposase
MARGDLSNEKWAKIEPLLPPEQSGKKGRPYLPHRQIINGILWRSRTGTGWRDIPERYGPFQTCYDRFVRFRKKGLWQNILELLQADQDAQGQLDWDTACVDGSVIRAHQHAAGASFKSSTLASTTSKSKLEHRQSEVVQQAGPAFTAHQNLKERVQATEALGYSQGGFSTKIHLVCDGRGRPLAASLSPGQAHESKHLATTLDGIRVPHKGPGRPRKRPK